MRKVLSTIVLVILAAGAGLLVYYFINVSLLKGTNTETVKFKINSGVGINEVTQELKNQGVIRDKLVFRVYLFVTGNYSEVQPGTYFIDPEQKMKQVAEKITPDPDVRTEVEVKIIEGWTIMDIGQYLEDQGLLDQEEFVELAETTDTRDILPEDSYSFLVDKPVDQGLEGYLFPDTYRVYADSKGPEIIARMLDNFEQKVEIPEDRNVFEVLTLASVIEKEVRTKEERKMAAGIFLNRLDNGIALQSDATVNYVTGKATTMPSLEDLQSNSEYNTYLYKGLPPGPICNPSLDSIEAVLNPTESDYLYFLTKPDGTAVFAETYEEHLANKEKYYGQEE